VIARPPLPAGPFLVVGLARSGAAAARILRDHGEVIGADSGSPDVPDLHGVEVHLQVDGLELLDRVKTVVKSPGVPQQAPVIATARARGIDVTGELEIAWRLLPNEFVAITGTNGKTTTTELLGAVHREAGVPVAVAGNVGTPLSSLVGKLRDEVVVAECSSFQLEDSSAFAAECAVLLNLAEDHLDRHRTFAAYRAAKVQFFERLRSHDVAVIPRGFELTTPATTVTFGGPGADLENRDDFLWWRGEQLVETSEIRLIGAHNRENAMAASAAAIARGIEPDAVRRALTTFPGVEHRLEEVAARNGIRYFNDSKATNVTSTRVALEAFEGGVHLIVGGRAKGGGFRSLRDGVTERCRAVYVIGEAAEELARDLDGAAPVHECGDLEHAVGAARRAARAGEVILLSPACASYDQYRDYEQRGRRFRDLARG